MSNKVEINKYNPDLDGLRWVLRAKPKDDNYGGFKLHYLYHEDGYWLATDGHRLHCYESKGEYDNGHYEVIKNTKTLIIMLKVEDDLKFPDWERVFPRHEGNETMFSARKPLYGYTKLIRSMNENETLNFDYFEDAVDDQELEVVYYGKTQPVCLWNGPEGDQLAVIMPMRLEAAA